MIRPVVVALMLKLALGGGARAEGPEFVPPMPSPAKGKEQNLPAAEGALATPALATDLASDPGAPVKSQLWVTGDILLGWMRGGSLPPLVTTSGAGTAKADAGVLGVEGTQVLFGASKVNEEIRVGGRLGAGYWFSPERRLGADATFFFLGNQTADFSASSDGSRILARPILDAQTEKQTAILIAFPGLSAGTVSIRASSENFLGGSVGLREKVIAGERCRLESLIGYRFLRYDDRVTIRQTLLPLGGDFVPGTRIDSEDGFSAENVFHGIEFGFRTEFYAGNWSLEVLAKMAAGRLEREVSIAGRQVISVPGDAPDVSNSGVLALSSNSGVHDSDDWVVAPEVGLNLGWQVTSRLKLRAGYTFLFLGQVARAGDQINLTVNQDLLPPPVSGGPLEPAFHLRRTDLFIHAVNLGMEFHF